MSKILNIIAIALLSLASAQAADAPARNVTPQTPAADSTDPQLTKELRRASLKFNLALDATTIKHFRARGGRISIGALTTEPASALAFSRGVTVAFGFFQLPRLAPGYRRLPPAFYSVRVRAARKAIDLSSKDGKPASAKAEFLNAAGNVIATVPINMTIAAVEPARVKSRVVIEPAGNAQRMAFCMRLGNGSYTVCWGADWLNNIAARK
jgi:hypothetical protein